MLVKNSLSTCQLGIKGQRPELNTAVLSPALGIFNRIGTDLSTLRRTVSS